MGFNGYNKPLTEPLGISDVCSVLGENTLTIDLLCRSKSINTKSFHKPMKTETPKELTLTDKYSIDAGYDLTTMQKDTLVQVAELYTDGKTLNWEVKECDVWFRLTDFIGYNPVATDFSPTGSLTLPLSAKEPSMLYLRWESELENHLQNFATYKNHKQEGTSVPGYGILGLLIVIANTPYLYPLGKFGEVTIPDYESLSIPIEELHSTAIGWDKVKPTKSTLYAMPILVDFGCNNSSLLATGLGNQLYDNYALANRGVSPITTQYAPYRFLALNGTPFKGVYKNMMYRIYENLEWSFYWNVGPTNTSKTIGVWEGDAIIVNNNSFPVEVSMRIYGQGDGWIELFTPNETGETVTIDGIERTFFTVPAGQPFSARVKGSVQTSFPLHETNQGTSFGGVQIRVETAVRVKVDGWAGYESAYIYNYGDKNFDNTMDSITIPYKATRLGIDTDWQFSSL